MDNLKSGYEMFAEHHIERSEIVDENDPRVESYCTMCSNLGSIKTPQGVIRCPECRKRSMREYCFGKISPVFPDYGISLADVERWDNFKKNEVYNKTIELKQIILDKAPLKALLFAGQNGRGKTKISLALLHDLSKCGIQVFAVRFDVLVKLSKKGIDGNKSIERIYRNAKAAEVLLIDEIGKEPVVGNDEHKYMHMRELVDIIYDLKYAILNTNLTLMELKSYFTNDVYSRLCDAAGYCESVSVKGDDLRQKARVGKDVYND